MSVFADTSALMRLYVDETGYEVIREIPVFVVSQIVRVEVPAALWRKERMGEVSRREATVLVADFERDYYGIDRKSRFVATAVNSVVLEAAARLARIHGLRAYDSVQLASAVLAAEGDPEINEFAVWDKKLREAALAEGFTLIPS